jgi:predicted Ser/Thr protein kinase
MEKACRRFEAQWQGGEQPRIEDYLEVAPASDRPALVRDLLFLELAYRCRHGDRPPEDEYLRRFPEYAAVVEAVFSGEGPSPTWPLATGDSGMFSAATTPESPGDKPVTEATRLGRYRVERVLGRGGFGVVYLAHDDQLHRQVAIKVPHRERISSPQDAEAYLAEARILASLDHPHVVPVYDVGSTEDSLPFVVSKFIEGSDLRQKFKEARPSVHESAALVATVAEALHHAHLKGLVHRDIKPANILIDRAGKPHVADFGLALKEDDFGRGPGFAGTPVYMSPEQARGAGHLVDGRSDNFSLGVVFYELLTGRLPFRGQTRDELLERIANVEARPPRQANDGIPKELERICLKALAKRASERYSTARDMADDLRNFLGHVAAGNEKAPAKTSPATTTAGRRRRFLWAGAAVAALAGVPLTLICLTPSGYLVNREAGQLLAPPGESSWRSSLEIGNGAMEGRTYELLKHRVVLGRNADCDISLGDGNASRYHAQLVRTDGGYCIEDMGSPNGTYVNGKRFSGRVPLQNNDRIHIGDIVLIYHTVQIRTPSPSSTGAAD